MTEVGKVDINDVIGKLPRHLMDLIIDQPYNEYTHQDQSVWRYVMRQNVNFLSKNAHESYVKGLRDTGISVETIPHMYGMNRILEEIGWAAVSVDGFIPPQAFMEFQAYNVLVIAADIRNAGNIEYTPAPDIIHEAAGHAPIIADPKYANYLKLFGEIGAKSFSSKADYDLYEAIRHLSIIKENPHTKPEQVDAAEKRVAEIQDNMGAPSEMSQIRNLHWWTVEYGLIGSLTDYKIYGAGLLSSRGESVNCMDDTKVKKMAYSIDAANFAFDITNEQPHLFVTKGFDELTEVLLEFSEGMAYKVGGLFALERFRDSVAVGSAVFDSGLTVAGVLSEIVLENEKPCYLKFSGPCQLAEGHNEIANHGKGAHAHGFGMPMGMVKNIGNTVGKSIAEFADKGIRQGSPLNWEFESGVLVQGVVTGFVCGAEGKVLLIQMDKTTVTKGSDILFDPSWGTFDLALATEVTSCYSGPADPLAFELRFDPPAEKTLKINYSSEEKEVHDLYGQVRELREQKNGDFDELLNQVLGLESDWLLAMELFEIATDASETDKAEVLKEALLNKSEIHPKWKKLILDGISLVEAKFPLIYVEN